MKFLKPNLDLIITGLVVVLAVAVAMWQFSSTNDVEKTKATERLSRRDQALQQIFTHSKPIDIPGYGKLPDAKDQFEVTYAKNLTDAKKEAQEQMLKQADEISAIATDWNRKGRVVVKGVKPNEHFVPLLNGKEEDHFLPTVSGVNPWAFKADYEKQFPSITDSNGEWALKLRFGLKPDPAAVELNSRTIAKEIDERIKAADEEAKKIAAANQPAGGGVVGAANIQLPAEEQSRIRRGVISNRAASLRCYVDEKAFQPRPWYNGAVPPDETEIFEALVDSWLINDVVNAIHGVNEATYSTLRLPESQRNVGVSAVKRLESVTVGGSEGMGNGLFLSMGSTGSGGGGGAPMAGGEDRGRSLTGHVGNTDYDVVWMNIKVVVDPAYLNQFIDSLYRQNNGYTVLNIKTTPVDPLDAASNGYLYGDTQCVRVEIRVEDIMFRSWTTPLMPQSVRTALGLGPIPVSTK